MLGEANKDGCSPDLEGKSRRGSHVGKSVFEIIVKFQSHGQNRAQRLHYIICGPTVTCDIIFIGNSAFVYKVSQKFHLPNIFSHSDEHARKV